MSAVQPIITPEELLHHWQGHRSLTRRVIEAFPDEELFRFSIGGMRTFGDLAKELLAIAAPGIREIVSDEPLAFEEERDQYQTKEDILRAWDEATVSINDLWGQISPERFRETVNLFGQYNFPVIHNILYFIDNEIHHRGQGYVYLRGLGIEPPYFWER